MLISLSMATWSDQEKLIETSGEVFEDLILEDFSNQLIGIATGNYIPMEEDEILLEKGDHVAITEQTLDGRFYIVMNQRTDSSGKVPVEYVNIISESGDSADTQESRPKYAIVRRSGVSKTKGERFRRSHVVERDDGEPLIDTYTDGGHAYHPPVIVNIDDIPTDEPSYHRESGQDKLSRLPDNSNLRLAVVGGLNDGDKMTTSLDRDMLRPRKRAQTRENRATTINLLPDVPPEYKFVEKYNIVSVSGADHDGRPVIVFSSCRLPPSYQINHDRLLEYFKMTLDKYVEQDYTLVYFHHGFSSSNKPSFTWMRQVYRELDRKYKKNLKKLYIVHPSSFIRVLMILFKPLISYKFGKKVTYINRLAELEPVLYLDQIEIPVEVKRYDSSLTTPVRDVTHTQSRSVFHVPTSPRLSPEADINQILSTKHFGVALQQLKEREGCSIPLVMSKCVEYLEENCLTVEGIFRRASNTTEVHRTKKKIDSGEPIVFDDTTDPHLVAVLLKLFLRELPEPLLTYNAYGSVTQIRGKSAEMRVQVCKEVVRKLPELNYKVLLYLVEFLNKVVDNEEENKMTALNLAIVFGPNLIWGYNEAASLTSLGEINSFTYVLIEHYDEIFTS